MPPLARAVRPRIPAAPRVVEFPIPAPAPASLATPILNVGLAVVPGQPLSITWGLESQTLSVKVGDLQASFFVIHPKKGKILINNAISVPISGGYAVDGTPISFSQNTELTPLDDNIGSSVYDIHASDTAGGLRFELDLILTGSDANNNPLNLSFSATGGYFVVKDLGAAWQWTSTSSAPWNSVYQVAGTFLNRCQFQRLTPLSMELDERDSSTGVSRLLQVSSPGEVVPGDAVPIVAATITQNWRWFDPGNYNLAGWGPLSKTFTYTVSFGFQDQYGNRFPLPEDGFPLFLSSVLSVTVSVSQEKRAHQMAASLEYALFVGSAGFAAILAAAAAALFFDPPAAALVGILAAAAGAAAAAEQAQAQGDANAANDPIEPDFHLRDYARSSTPALPRALDKQKRFPHFKELLSFTGMMQATENAIYLTLPRVLGAKLANAYEDLRLQTKHCESLITQLASAAAKLPTKTSSAVREIDAVVLRYQEQISGGLFQVKIKGIPADIKEQLFKSGVPANLVTQADSDIRSGAFPIPKVVLSIAGRETSLFSVQLRNVSKARIETAKSVATMARAFLTNLRRKPRHT